MAQFEPFKNQISQQGSLVFVAAEKRSGLFKPEKFLEKHPISFPFLLDEDRSVTKAWGVYKAMGIDSINIARPASFVVDVDGCVLYLYVGSNQMDRPPVRQVIESMQRSGKTRQFHQT